MELTINMGEFESLEENDMIEIDGGFFGPVLFTVWGTKVLVGHALSAGATLGLAALATN